MSHLEPFKLIFRWKKMISSRVMHLAFATQSGQPFDFIPGQFITIQFEWQGEWIKRSYSIATQPGKSEFVEIAATNVEGGPGTEFLFHLQDGQEVEVTGPFGRLILEDETVRRYFLVATGTGVTPYRAMLTALEHQLQEKRIEVVLLLGARSRDDLIYADEFVAFAQQHPHFQFLACYSRDFPSDPLPFERRHYVLQTLSTFKLNPAEDLVYLCGNPIMIDDTFTYLKEIGFDAKRVKREKYISSKAKVKP